MPLQTATVLPALKSMQPGDHYCGMFRSDADHRRIVVDFVRLGVERHERVLYLVNLTSMSQLSSILTTAGLEVESLIEKGQLVVRSARDAYLVDGVFQPEKMIELLRQETASALDAGFTALRVTGEMTWALTGDPGSERLMEYEAMLNTFYAEHPKTYSICQYDQRRFDADLLNDVLHTHPKALIGTDGFDNSTMYYVPPEALLSPNRAEAILETRLSNLTNKL